MTVPGLNDTAGDTVEQVLTELLEIQGLELETVLEALRVLFGQARWSDYQRIENMARNIARRLERKE